MKLSLIVLALTALAACEDPFLDEDKYPEPNAQTPAGYWAYMPPLVELDQAAVLAWLDLRIEEWVQLRKDQLGEGFVRAVALDQVYELVDDWHFTAYGGGLFCCTGATGQYLHGDERVVASIYFKGVDPENYPVDNSIMDVGAHTVDHYPWVRLLLWSHPDWRDRASGYRARARSRRLWAGFRALKETP